MLRAGFRYWTGHRIAPADAEVMRPFVISLGLWQPESKRLLWDKSGDTCRSSFSQYRNMQRRDCESAKSSHQADRMIFRGEREESQIRVKHNLHTTYLVNRSALLVITARMSFCAHSRSTFSSGIAGPSSPLDCGSSLRKSITNTSRGLDTDAPKMNTTIN